VALGGWPVLNFPVALFEVEDNGICDLMLLVLSERSAHTADHAQNANGLVLSEGGC
jgi:hypothetical protein